MAKRVGVFVCHCGSNIASSVDVKKVSSQLGQEEGVVHTEDIVFMCSDPGQSALINAIKEHDLDSVVVSACSINLHEKTFRDATEEAGLNPYQCEIANIREQCSWVHMGDEEKATEKAIKISKATLQKVIGNDSLEPIKIPVNRRAMVVGGGVAGIQCALDLANAGIEVVLVEKEPTIGGKMIGLSETFPTLDCSQCILSPKMVEVSKHPKIKLMTYCEVEEVGGYVGNFKVKVKQKPRYVDPEVCKLCPDCSVICPIVVPDEYNLGLSGRRAIFMPFPQAVPPTYTLDLDACMGLNPIACGKCAEPDVCRPQAINYDRQAEIIEEEVGAIVLATGFDLMDKEELGEYGHGKIPDVLDGLQFERLCSAAGPTGGKVLRLSDHKVPKKVVFIQCAGSRDPENHCAYCSKICCMYTAKHAMLYKHKVPDGEAYIFYIDIRSGGKGYEEFVQRAVEHDHINYLRGKVSKLYEQDGQIRVMGTDTLSGENVRIDADMVVLALAMKPSKGTADMARKFKVGLDKDGFLAEAHPKLKPVESVTAGMFLAGAGQSPKDIPETVSQASAAAVKVIGLLSNETLAHNPNIANIHLDKCTGCNMCVDACPYGALSLNRGKAEVNSVLCEGCGVCMATCLRAAVDIRNFAPQQMHEMIEAALDW